MRSIDALTYFKGDDLAAKVWTDKYALRNENGEVVESNPDQMHLRMAKEFARIEAKYDGPNILSEQEIMGLFQDFRYIVPGGSVMAGLGSKAIGSLSNCFVIGQPEDSYSGIMKLREEQAHLMKRRGGVGKDLSTLRPSGASVKNAAKSSTGAASFMDVDSAITTEVAQRGRRGALMLTLDIRHPDVEEFITRKQDLTKVTGANISVKVTDDFMKAVMNDEDYILRWPVTTRAENTAFKDLEYGKLLCLEHPRKNTCCYYKKVRARKLWELLIHCAWNTAEPGIMFEDRHIEFSPDGVYPQYRGVSTNPCGEIFMQPYDSCRLIHINLTSFVKRAYYPDASIDYELLQKVAKAAIRLGDDLVDLEVEAIGQILGHIASSKGDNHREFKLWMAVRDAALASRRCGVGFTGLADTLAMLKVGFNDDGIGAVDAIMNTIFKAELESTIDLAEERGTFLGWDRDKELAHVEGNEWYQMVAKTFPDLYDRMMNVGRRNVSFSTVAPTGTVSILTQTSSGIEPVFSLYYTRRKKCVEGEPHNFVDQNGEKYQEFKVFHRPFLEWARLKLDLPTIEVTLEYIEKMSADELTRLVSWSPWYKNTAPEIDWDTRLGMQSVVQYYTTHSISSTLNLPSFTTEGEISKIYLKAWEYNLKGVTVYRDGCRAGVLVTDTKPKQVFEQHSAPKRPKTLDAELHVVKVKKIKYAVIVGLMEGKPYETFAFELGEGNFLPQSGKIIKVKRGCYNFVGENDLIIENIHLANDKLEERSSSIYISMLLRHGAPIEYVIATAKKVNENIASFTSAVCRVLMKYCTKDIEEDSCPDCGTKLSREAGCKKCNNCGYSLCLLMLTK
jgi:ribonucleoside-diphosphate reductase alpha chain